MQGNRRSRNVTKSPALVMSQVRLDRNQSSSTQMLLICTTGPALGWDMTKAMASIIFSVELRFCYPNIALLFLSVHQNKPLIDLKTHKCAEKWELPPPYIRLTLTLSKPIIMLSEKRQLKGTAPASLLKVTSAPKHRLEQRHTLVPSAINNVERSWNASDQAVR